MSINININKRRNLSTISQLSQYNSWFMENPNKSSVVPYRSNQLSESQYRSANFDNPESKLFKQGVQVPKLRRTFSAFKNSQSRVTGLKDRIFDLSQEIRLMIQKTKKTKLSFDMMSKQLRSQLTQRDQSLKQNIQNLSKQVKSIIKVDEMRTQQIKTETDTIKVNYSLIKTQIEEIKQRLAAIEHQCGFITFASKLAQ